MPSPSQPAEALHAGLGESVPRQNSCVLPPAFQMPLCRSICNLCTCHRDHLTAGTAQLPACSSTILPTWACPCLCPSLCT